MGDPYLVETPEAVPIAYEPAGLGSRCLAAAGDTLLLGTLLIALGALLLVAGEALEGGVPRIFDLLLAVWSLLSFALIWGYYVAFELIWSGQTPGKRLLGLRVLREGGRPLDFAAAAIRNLLRGVDFLPFGYGIGAIALFADRRGRRLGDLAAGTLVVREGQTVRLADLLRRPGLALPPRAPDAPATPLLPSLEQLDAESLALAADFLRQRDGLAHVARARLAHGLAAHLRARIGLAASDGDPERFIEHLLRERELAQAIAERHSA